MSSPLGSRLMSAVMALMVTLTIAGSLDALATTGQSAEALLSQHQMLQLACTDPSPRKS